MKRAVIVAAIAFASASGCSAGTGREGGPTSPAPARAEAGNGRWDAKLLQTAHDYESWGRVDDQYRWAPFLCNQPKPGVARFSEASSEHGQKLYSLFATDRAGYVEHKAPGAGGQVIVKEAWLPEEVADVPPEPTIVDRTLDGGDRVTDAFLPYATRGGKHYRAARRAGLFMMFTADPRDPETDEGWVYGTVAADGRTVTSAGRVASCMGCHQQAPHGRLFGLPSRDR